MDKEIPEGLWLLTNNEYHSLDACSKSRLDQINRSAKHLDWYLKNPTEKTKAMSFGDAFHSHMLDPFDFETRFVVGDKIDKRTKEGKAKAEQFELENKGKELLTTDDYDTILKMDKSLRSHAIYKDMLSHPDLKFEWSVIWRDPGTNIYCKSKPDIIWRSHDAIVDLKTTDNATIDHFKKTVVNMRYHVQAAMYLRAVNQTIGIEKPFKRFMIVAVEKEPPFEVAVFELSFDAISLGETDLDRNLADYAEWLKNKDKPLGYPETVQVLDLPKWAYTETTYQF